MVKCLKMIVTFHLAVFYAYHIWETYISSLFRNTNSDNRSFSNTDNGNVSPENTSNYTRVQNNSSPHDVNQPKASEMNLDERSKSEPRLPRSVGHQQSNEGESDLPQIVKLVQFHEKEGGRKSIYDVKPTFSCTQESKGMKFSPPVYIQRYMIIEGILKEQQWAESIKKVVDYGCAELSFEVRCLKKLFGVYEILAVDKDEHLLDVNRKKVCPTPTDFLQCRPTPLNIKVLCGSVANTHEILKNTDAVIAIELIEHLFPFDLECLPFTVFGYIQPKIAMFTTPNADFNVLFPGFSGFRHDDHKFEWSREQFEDWGNNLVQRYTNYTVTFQGIGPGPAGTEHFGCCSQMATFIKLSNSQPIPKYELHVQDGPYDILEECEYPYFVDTRTKEEVMKDEAIFFLNRCALLRKVFTANDDSDTTESAEIPLSVVMDRVKCLSMVQMRNILVNEKWEVRKNAAGCEVVILPDDDSNYSSSESSEDFPENDFLDQERTSPYMEENWDCDETVEPTDSLDPVLQCDLHNDCIFTPVESVLSSTNVILSDDLDKATQEKTKVSNSFIDSTSDVHNSLQDHLVNEVSCSQNSSFDSSLQSVMQNETALDCSVYKTPQSSSWKIPCVNNDVPSNHQSIVSECNDLELFSTPCCSQLHKTQIPKSLSLQEIKSESPMEGLINNESFEVNETYSNASKIVDSGYPDSYSDHDMDLDLTPEQIDDIDTESDENISGLLPSPLVALQAPLVIDDVENGDVANNNRDGEGNNLIVDMEEEPIEFDAQIVEELYEEVPNLEGAVVLPRKEFKELSGGREPVEDQIYHGISYQQLHTKLNNSPIRSEKVNLMNNTDFVTEQTSLRVKISTDKHPKASQSNYSSAASDSWSQVELPETQSLSNYEEKKSSCASKENHTILKSPNSLTTVLDGYSNLSNCSIVQPVDDSEREGEEIITSLRFPKPLLEIGGVARENEKGKEESIFIKVDVAHSLSSNLHQANNSVVSLSEYCSAESLNSRIEDEMLEISDIPHFPSWLLNIDCDFLEEFSHDSSSVFSLLDNDSFEGSLGLNFDVPVDSRGGGDPQGYIHL